MRFDDRLATVLRARTSGAVVARIQFRQLLDLLGTLPAEVDGPIVDDAFARLGELSATISAEDRAAMLAEPGLRLRSPRLVACLAGAEPGVAQAAIAAARLDEEQWLDLIPALPVAARGLMRHRRDLGPRATRLLERLGIGDRALPPADLPPAAAQPTAAPAEPIAANDDIPPPPAAQGIGAIVERIEAFRRNRTTPAGQATSADAPRLPLDEETILAASRPLRAFDFATDAGGRIIWTDPGVAPMAVGLPLLANDPSGPVEADADFAADFRRRQMLRARALTIAGAPAIAGDWQLDASPAFDPLGGRFAGYRGRMRRPAAPIAAPDAAASEGDRIRQLLHELRTPVNAIQGFAEIIQQQLFGPSPHEYRALAATIAGDAARMLAGFEELERLARLDTGALELEAGDADFTAVLAATVAQLEHHTAQRDSGFTLAPVDGPLAVPLARIEAERLCWRLLATLAGACAPGEVLKLRLRARDDQVRLTMQLPSSLAARTNADLFSAGPAAVPQALSAGMFGAGFALRLAASEARAAGGDLARSEGKLRLVLPTMPPQGLTAMASDHSHEAESGGPAAGAA